MTIDSVGVSNTSGYSFTGGDPTSTGGIVGMGNGISSYTPMTGGGRKRKGGSLRRKLTKKLKRMRDSRVKSVKKYVKKKKRSHRLKKRIKRRTIRQDIIKSIERGEPIDNERTKKLTPSMQSFLKGIETDKSSSVIKFSDFKSEPGKKKSKKKKSKAATRGGNLVRGGNLMKGGARNCKSCGHYHRGGCSGSNCKKKKKKKSFFGWF